MRNRVDSVWLKQQLEDKNVRVVDCRFQLGDPSAGRKQFEENHIRGAVYFDLEKDLSGAVGKHGGRHPLPDLLVLKARLEVAGISNHTTIVAYDEKEGAYASRFWWLLKYLGHERVYILDGGYAAWKEAGFPVEQETRFYSRAEFQVSVDSSILAAYDEVKDITINGSRKALLIDSREERRYLGIEEPIDRIAGHIPHAINKPWMEGIEDGTFKSKEEQEKRFSGLDKNQPIIVYCGSGVTATPNFIALKEAGYRNVKLYAGSYSDWVSYEDNPIETGNSGS